MALGVLLKAYRSRTGLTQEELAHRAGISVRAVSDAERGLRSRMYRDTAARLADALGLTAEERVEFGIAAHGQPAKTVSQRARIPFPPNRLVGRDREVERLIALAHRPNLRLITVCGPGGVGKSRLALAVAAQLDEAAYLDLGDIVDPSLVLPAVARALGVARYSEPSLEAITEAVDQRGTWLVLDTVENVLEAAADIAGVLAAASELRVLATSREALRIRGEHQVVLAPLDLQPGGSAGELFRERAQAVNPDEPLDDRLVEQICRKVSGIPLALELAAARVKHLPLSILTTELDHALAVLTHGPRDLPSRQQTMRGTIAWSYNRLPAREQQVFRNLCAVPGGCQLDVAMAVAGDDALEICGVLIDHSLVFRVGDRFDMYDVIREFGLEAGPDPDVPVRHLQACIDLAERAEQAFGKAGQRAWNDRIASERVSLGAALRFAIEGGDGASALRIATSAWRYWQQLGDLTEGRRWLRAALALPVPASMRSRALWGLAWLAYHQGGIDEARWCATEMLALSDEDPIERRNALTVAGLVAMAEGDPARAVTLFEECVELLPGVEDGWLLATSYLNLGIACAHAMRPTAEGILREARDRYLALGDSHFATRAGHYLALPALLRGDLNTAAAVAAEAAVAFWELDDLWGTVEALEMAGAVYAADGRAKPAAMLSAAAGRARRTGGTRPLPLDCARIDQFIDSARDAASDAEWGAWSDAGIAMGLATAVALAAEVVRAS